VWKAFSLNAAARRCAQPATSTSTPKDLDILPAMADDEDAMLEDTASERKPTSRLSCQLDACDELTASSSTFPASRHCERTLCRRRRCRHGGFSACAALRTMGGTAS